MKKDWELYTIGNGVKEVDWFLNSYTNGIYDKPNNTDVYRTEDNFEFYMQKNNERPLDFSDILSDLSDGSCFMFLE